MVEDVEELGAQLHVEPLAQPLSLHQREIPVAITGTTEDVPPGVPEARLRGAWPEHGLERDGTPDGKTWDVAHFLARDHVPAVSEFTGLTKVISEVESGPWRAGLEDSDGIDLPALEQLPEALVAGQVVAQREGEAMADIKVAIAALKIRPQAVLRLRRTVQRCKVNRMRPRIAPDECDAVPGPLGDAGLQAMIGRAVKVFHKVDESQERKFGLEGSSAIGKRNLVDVADAVELHSTVADITHLERSAAAEGLLDIQVPAHHIRRPQIARDPQDIAGRAGITGGLEAKYRTCRAPSR